MPGIFQDSVSRGEGQNFIPDQYFMLSSAMLTHLKVSLG